MIDLPKDETLMISGLDAWVYPSKDFDLQEFIIREERLERRLGVTHFRRPPDFRIPSQGVTNASLTIPAIRFPQWHSCRWCGAMEKLELFSDRKRCPGRLMEKGRTCANTPEKRRPFLAPVRFLNICKKGHISDFPWMTWVHGKEGEYSSNCKLKLSLGGSASLQGIFVGCSCGKFKSMKGAFGTESISALGITCGGEMPWLADTQHSPSRCGEELRAVAKGGSNVFFPITVSSIYLPLWAEDAAKNIIDILEDQRLWPQISQATENGQPNRAIIDFIANTRNVDASELMAYACRKISGETSLSPNRAITEEEFRKDEYTALREGRGNPNSELSTRLVDPSHYRPSVSDVLSKLTLVDQLRETRAYVGFSRVIPESSVEYSAHRSMLRLDPKINWIPGITVTGEGIFMEFDRDKIENWAENPSVQKRAQLLARNYHIAQTARGVEIEANVTAKFFMLHTLAHLLITQLSFDCGYGSSSLKERIYCDLGKDDDCMQGILIYTASGDSEGTMGGLVRQGEKGNLENIFTRAIRNSGWCSSDPICIESKGQGPGSCNLAACHSCSLLAETSCDHRNQFLDRAFIVGTKEEPEIGFFYTHSA